MNKYPRAEQFLQKTGFTPEQALMFLDNKLKEKANHDMDNQ